MDFTEKEKPATGNGEVSNRHTFNASEEKEKRQGECRKELKQSKRDSLIRSTIYQPFISVSFNQQRTMREWYEH